MVLPKSLAVLNRRVTNRVARPVARNFHGFAVVEHIGRKSGTRYATPVNAWLADSAVVIPLTYGSDVDWLRNAQARGTAVLVIKGEILTVEEPVLVDGSEGRARIPHWVGMILTKLGVDQFVLFRLSPTS